MEIRLATPDDARRLANLRYDFRASMNAATESRASFVERCEPWMASRLAAKSSWRCWVADDAGLVVGHLWLQLIEKVPNPAPELEVHAYVTNVFVEPGARGGGAGELLVEAALAFCRDAAVDSVILWPTEKSRTLYARHGFAVPDDMMEAVLDSGRDLH